MIPMPIELLCVWLLLQKKLHYVNTFVRRTYNLLQIESLLFAKMGEKGAHHIRLFYVSFIHETDAFFFALLCLASLGLLLKMEIRSRFF